MATAVEPSSAPSAPSKPMSLAAASLIGAVYGLAALAVVVWLLPALWAEHVTPKIKDNLLDWMCWIPALFGTIVALVWFGRKMTGEGAPKGVHGGVFLMISAAITIFFLARAVGLWFTGPAPTGTVGLIVMAAAAVALLYFAVRYFTGQRGTARMVGLEEQGLFSFSAYKRSLGVRVRRITILGFLLLGGSGAWALDNNGVLPEHWTLALPFNVREEPVTVTQYEYREGVAYPVAKTEVKTNEVLVMRGARFAIPALIVAITLWFGFRAVNMPTFAEFLIATEAEMNKVSWSTKRRLAQDTVVVLVTTLIMTLFLLVVDLFWGWLLSRQTVGVLPARSTNPDKGKAHEAKW